MIQIGETTYIDPMEVEAVGWDGYTERMPLVFMKSGRQLQADHYEIEREECRLIEPMQSAVIRLQDDIFSAQTKARMNGA